MEKSQVIAKIDNSIFKQGGLFKYLSDFERKEVLERFDNGTSFCVGIYSESVLRLAFVLDFDTLEFIHVREADGDFKHFYKYMNDFVSGACKGMGRKFLSMNIKKSALKKMAERLGWCYNQNDEYVKVI